jgi:hypothetical protein
MRAPTGGRAIRISDVSRNDMTARALKQWDQLLAHHRATEIL